MASSSRQIRNILLFTMLPFITITVVVAIGYWVYRRHKMALFNELPTTDPSPLPPPSPLLGLRPVQLLEVKAQGRFGAVWKAMINNEPVAVKIFPQQDKNSWIVEQEIYLLPQMKHDNILNFLGVEKRGDQFQVEYWLISSYHEKGSLCDYLKECRLIKDSSKKKTSRKCVVCNLKINDNGKRIRRETHFQCKDCNVGLCAVLCFEKYHTVAFL
ncbi:activin receptor type-2A [Trichonephila clavipes]|uniref:receptor protein serine/threonine kinase n=1 Tax=Trichonephila clavipes TaxID=2585209 RepID=A0A8X6SJ04_TRICX|nr:activin receptor type-2A [Trichonephila clavipes]